MLYTKCNFAELKKANDNSFTRLDFFSGRKFSGKQTGSFKREICGNSDEELQQMNLAEKKLIPSFYFTSKELLLYF